MFVCWCRVDVDSSDESDMEDDLEQPAVLKTKHHDLMMKGEGGRKGSFFKQAKKSYPMFPTHEERIKWDEYGEIIRYYGLHVLWAFSPFKQSDFPWERYMVLKDQNKIHKLK